MPRKAGKNATDSRGTCGNFLSVCTCRALWRWRKTSKVWAQCSNQQLLKVRVRTRDENKKIKNRGKESWCLFSPFLNLLNFQLFLFATKPQVARAIECGVILINKRNNTNFGYTFCLNIIHVQFAKKLNSKSLVLVAHRSRRRLYSVSVIQWMDSQKAICPVDFMQTGRLRVVWWAVVEN